MAIELLNPGENNGMFHQLRTTEFAGLISLK